MFQSTSNFHRQEIAAQTPKLMQSISPETAAFSPVLPGSHAPAWEPVNSPSFPGESASSFETRTQF
jgi:hypothetical protein